MPVPASKSSFDLPHLLFPKSESIVETCYLAKYENMNMKKLLQFSFFPASTANFCLAGTSRCGSKFFAQSAVESNGRVDMLPHWHVSSASHCCFPAVLVSLSVPLQCLFSATFSATGHNGRWKRFRAWKRFCWSDRPFFFRFNSDVSYSRAIHISVMPHKSNSWKWCHPLHCGIRFSGFIFSLDNDRTDVKVIFRATGWDRKTGLVLINLWWWNY